MAERISGPSFSSESRTITIDEVDTKSEGFLSVTRINIFIKTLCRRGFSSGVLESIKVLDLTRIVAGPYCTMILGDLGAEVIKVEQPGTGDETRLWPPYSSTTKEFSCYFASLNRNKKSICVNLKSTEGKKIIFELAKKCDVLVENYVPGKLDELGIGYSALNEIAPHLIYCSLSGYGNKGLYRNKPGYDVIAASVGGLLHITGPREGEPCKTGVALTDIATGLYAHGAILAALLERTKTKQGQKIDCNLLSTQLACLINIGSNFLNANIEGSRWGTAHESIVPYESFKTADGYITVGAASNSQFKSLCKKLELYGLIEDEQFLTNELRVKNRESLISFLKPHFQSKTTSALMKLFEGSSFPHGPVNTLSQDVTEVQLTLRKPKTDKGVKWSTDTVDNEHLNKKKSKCCCIYEKPRNFGESSSESDGECDNCFGHVEMKCKKKEESHSPTHDPPPDPTPVPDPDTVSDPPSGPPVPQAT